MPCLRWVGLRGYEDVCLLPTGRCHIFHDDVELVSSEDLRGLPCSWLIQGQSYSCAELPCGHTFHVSALALSFLTAEMRCPLCRRGSGFAMSPECVPEIYRQDFLRLILDMQDSTDNDNASATGSDAESIAETEISEYSEWEGAGSPVNSTQWVYYHDYVECERQLRLLVEIQNSASEMFVLESPVHFAGLPRQDGELVLDMDLPTPMCVCMHKFYTQRSFCRHLHSTVRSLSAHGTPVSLRFALTHPLFMRPVLGAVSSTNEQVVMQYEGAAGADPGADLTGPVNVGLLRLNYAECSMSLVLEPHLLVSMWHDGLLAQHASASMPRCHDVDAPRA